MENYKGRTLNEGTKVYVYYNLHQDCFSIKALEGEFKGLIVLHTPGGITLNQVEFKVRHKGREKVIKEQRKEVHAGIIGRIQFLIPEDLKVKEEITYYPYVYPHFIYKKTEKPIYSTSKVVLLDRKVFLL